MSEKQMEKKIQALEKRVAKWKRQLKRENGRERRSNTQTVSQGERTRSSGEASPPQLLMGGAPATTDKNGALLHNLAPTPLFEGEGQAALWLSIFRRKRSGEILS